MGRLLAGGFEKMFHNDDGIKTVVLAPEECFQALWDPVDSVDGATVQVLMDILGSDADFYGRLFNAPHLAEYLAEPAKEDSRPIRYLEFKYHAERSTHKHCHPDGDFEFFPDVSGVGKCEDPNFPGGSDADCGYALDFTSLPSLAHLPVVVCDLVEMHEYGRKGKYAKSTMGRMPVLLIDVLKALVEEASFHGCPEERDGRMDDLKDRMKQVDADIASGKIEDYMTLDELRAKFKDDLDDDDDDEEKEDK